jgi:hypothetical protein
MLLGLSFLAFSLSAWFFIAVQEQSQGASTAPTALQPFIPRNGKAPETARTPQHVQKFVHFDPARIKTGNGEVDPNRHQVVPPAASDTVAAVPFGAPSGRPGPRPAPEIPFGRPSGQPVATGPGGPLISPGDPSVGPSGQPVAMAPPGLPSSGIASMKPPARFEGPQRQDVHRFILGPGLAPPLVTPVDPRLVWMVVGVFAVSNLTLVVVLGTGREEEEVAA